MQLGDFDTGLLQPSQQRQRRSGHGVAGTEGGKDPRSQRTSGRGGFDQRLFEAGKEDTHPWEIGTRGGGQR
jgi:hypothetical protein